MSGRVHLEGYAIVSADGMIADRHGHMPNELKVDADHRFFERGVNSAVLVVHGRHSHEQLPGSDQRGRLILTPRIAAIAEHPSIPNARLWNPAGATFADACHAMGVTEGMVTVIGGTGVFGLFLDIGFDAFHLSRVAGVEFPRGRPVFPQVPGVTPEQVLTERGLKPGPLQVLDAKAQATLVTWQKVALGD
jgi:dihydrofolate reductase